MKFIADVMLGRLAKRLRLLGFDTLYGRTLDDNGVIRLSLEQDRMILTRDLALAARPLAANHLVIRSGLVGEQVEQVLARFPPDAESSPLSRCSVCNTALALISKRDVKDLVPSYVYTTERIFYFCPLCGRTYWQGTHVKRMALPLEK